ncbi:hypothetical protein EMPG_14972 [Blastomyces silverae]|uniref:SWIM-type domain-containing protein n=1 Tax=Blastomyces silverae TaxID=2060906 RepID=A0A0H1BF15_9EURO|nr:hypothetical protein EMPG_14972 [Blastomyces silverae]
MLLKLSITFPAYLKQDDLKLVPIFCSCYDFSHVNQPCSHMQFPITVAYAITVHKSQELSLDQAVLNISEAEFQAGLTYVTIS